MPELTNTLSDNHYLHNYRRTESRKIPEVNKPDLQKVTKDFQNMAAQQAPAKEVKCSNQNEAPTDIKSLEHDYNHSKIYLQRFRFPAPVPANNKFHDFTGHITHLRSCRRRN